MRVKRAGSVAAVIMALCLVGLLFVPVRASAGVSIPDSVLENASIYYTSTNYTDNTYMDAYIVYIGANATTWNCSITFDGIVYNESAVDNTAWFWIGITTVKPDPNVTATDQSAIFLKVCPKASTATSQVTYNNATANGKGDTFQWDNSTITIGVVNTTLEVTRNGTHLDTNTIMQGVKPKYVFFSRGLDNGTFTTAGHISLTFSNLEYTDEINIMLYALIPTMCTLIVLTAVVGMVKRMGKRF